MKSLLLLFIILSSFQADAQASYHTQIAFILYDENDEKINLEQFKEAYKFVDVFGKIIPNEELENYLYYDEKTSYFILSLVTIGPRFSFALHHNNTSMVLYLPFINYRSNYYALNFKFRAGRYLFDFNTKNSEKIFFGSNMPYYVIDKINWRKQRRRLLKSSYADDKTYIEFKNK